MTIELEPHGDVTLVRIRGGKANAMNRALLDDLDRALVSLAGTAGIVLVGEGTSFSAGLALPELIDLDRTAMSWFIDHFAAVMLRALTFPGATVAAINGHAIAGGCVLALMCDARVMSAGKIGLNEVQIGIGLPAAVVEPLRLRVPPHALGPIALDGQLFDPEQARSLGLVDAVVPAERLEAHALELAARRVAHPLAHAQVKRALLQPILDAIERTRDEQREAWLETWFSPAAQTTLRATVARITKR
jgi:enoyl-CoA hydratase